MTGHDARTFDADNMFKPVKAQGSKMRDCWGSEWPGVLIFLKKIWTESQIRHCTDSCAYDGSTLQRENYFILNAVNQLVTE